MVTGCSIAWPVIDATYRYSLFEFGAMVAHAPSTYRRPCRVTCIESRHCPGNRTTCSAGSGIPVARDARGRVEIVRAGSAMSVLAGHYASVLAERETIRSCTRVKCRRPAEMTGPLARIGQVVTNRSTVRI